MTIAAHDFVIIRGDEFYRSVKLDPESMVSIQKSKVFLKNAIGHPYGTLFAVNGNQIEPYNSSLDQLDEVFTSKESPASIGSSSVMTHIRDNRDILMDPENQKLDQNDIESLRSSGISGDQMVLELVKGNANFDKRTKFSQEKYVSRKRKRHMGLFTIEKPCSRILCELYSKLQREKCLGLRFDALCHILSYANVHAGSKILLAETCSGLLLGGILERLGPKELGGSVIQFFHGSNPQRPEINPVAAAVYDKQVHAVSLLDVVPFLLGKLILDDTTDKNQVDDSSEHLPECHSDAVDSDGSSHDNDSQEKAPKLLQEKSKQAASRRALKLAKRRAAFDALGSNATPADALIVATKFHPVDMTLLLMQFLPIGKPIVVYSQFLQPLVELYNALKQRGGITQLRITDTFYRTIQVLPDRTHPAVTMLASGGYLLCAYTVEPKPTTEELLMSGLISSTKLSDERTT